ncbi:GNAT superfamily N-acetyltransferase [Sphingomonas leidyi]|uniref:GNAT superfamily N-acetyltransferase n=1 Tax=Sphingomonas leidyi TaxID=68569 RepID=A0A7X5UZY0_9SPHN|nr:GNAT family N-acetyltransferase [Sphingomonas leidyi]NIJ65344.1 GNAT superfamily N-acetyltransferase [Sphingomonas leidyi]
MGSESVTLRRVHALDGGIARLAGEADSEGHRFMRRLLDEWCSGANRFNGDGEFLLGVDINGQIAAIGGLNLDPYAADARICRLRHVYVSSAARRNGVGSLLVKRIIFDASRSFATLRLRTATPEAAAFYERLGLRKSNQEAATHILDLQA